MIKSHIEGIDASKYIYDTGLSFAKDLAIRIGELAKSDISLFPKRANYNRADNLKDLSRKIGVSNAKELVRRIKQMKETNEGDLISFDQHFLPEDIQKELLSGVPDWLLNVRPGEISCMLQLSTNGSYLGTHKGHKRCSSMFMLLEGQEQETRWYREKEPFDIIDPLRIPDLDKIELAVSAVIQPYRWYVFNHFEWHSVHRFSNGGLRLNIGLDFNTLAAEDLVALCKKHN